MKEELTNVTVEALKGLLENLAQAKGFVLEQAPDVLQGLVLVGRIESSLVVGVFNIIGWLIVWRVFSNHKNIHDQFPYAMGAFVFIAVPLCVAHDFITSWFAPKVYLVEHISKLIR